MPFCAEFRDQADNGSGISLTMSRRFLKTTVLLAVCATLLACTSTGPRTLPRDRLDYSDAVATSWQRQMLLNIVKLRYGEMPMFLDVASVINQYTLEGGLSGLLSPEGDNEYFARGTFTDRPTVTYTPLTGEAFTTSLLTPLSPAAIFSLVQSGWQVDEVLRICVRQINGINNQSAGLVKSVADPEFIDLLDGLAQLQRGGALSLRLTATDDPETVQLESTTYISIGDPPEELVPESLRVKSILGLEPAIDEMTLVFGGKARDSSEIAMLSRSVLDIMLEMAYSATVPEQDIAEGRAGNSIYDTVEGSRVPRMVHIHSGSDVPDGTRISVRYRDMWFWIDDTDMKSKLNLAFLLTLFSLSEGSGSGESPLLTIN